MIKLRNLDPSLVGHINAMGAIGFEQLLTQRVNYSESKIYYVDAHNGSDTNVGDSPATALASIAQAVTLSNARIDWTESPWARQDTIIVFPGVYAENITSLPYGGKIIGLGDRWDANGEMGVKIKPASGAPIDCASVINLHLENVWLESPDASTVFEADTLNRCVFKNVHFQGLPGASNTTLRGLDVTHDMTGNLLLGCTFWQCATGIYIDVDGPHQIVGTIFDKCFVGGAETAGFYAVSLNTPAFVFAYDCVFGDNSVTCANPWYDGDSAITPVNCAFIGTTITPATGAGYYSNCYHNGALVA